MKFFDKWNFPRRYSPGEEKTHNTCLTNTPYQNECSIKLKWAYPAFCITACALLVALTSRGGILIPKQIGTDSSVFRYVGKVILSGGMPYRDTFDHKGPLLYLIQVAGLSLGNQGIWVLEFLSLLVTFLYLYKTARLLGCGRRESCVSVLCSTFILQAVFEGGNLTEEYALPFLSVSLYIFLRYFIESQITKRRLMACGFCCAAVALLRVNMVGLWAVMCFGVIADCVLHKRILEIFHNAFWFLVGFLALTFPILLWLYVNHAFKDFIQDYFLFNFLYTSASTARASTADKLQAMYTVTIRPYNLLSIASLFYVGAVRKRFSDILCLVAIVVDIPLLCLSGQTYLHYDMTIVPLIGYAISCLFMEFSEMKTLHKRRFATLTVMLAAFILFSGQWMGTFVINKPNYQIAQIVRENSTETDYITVCGNSNSVYLFSDRQSVSKYSYRSPPCFMEGSEKSAEMREEYFRDVETRKPKIIVLPASYPGYDRVKDIVNRDYSLLDTVSDVEIYALSS